LCSLGAYFCLNMVLITLSSFLSVTVINIYMREDQNNKVPRWLRKVGERFVSSSVRVLSLRSQSPDMEYQRWVGWSAGRVGRDRVGQGRIGS